MCVSENIYVFVFFFIFILKNILSKLFINTNIIYIIIVGLFSCLIPDIDHPNSFLGNKIKFISFFIYNYLGHRKITHSLFFLLFIIYIFFKIKINLNIIEGFFLGYISHIFFDMITPQGVYIFWPLKKRIRFFY